MVGYGMNKGKIKSFSDLFSWRLSSSVIFIDVLLLSKLVVLPVDVFLFMLWLVESKIIFLRALLKSEP